MNNVSVRLVFDRKHKATKKHQASVQLEVTYLSRRKFVSTGIRLYSDQWGKDNKVKNHPQSILFNQQIADKVADIYDFAHDLQVKEEIFSFDKLDEHLKGESPLTQTSFLDFMSKRLEERPIAEGTRKHHRVILNALKDFGRIKSFDDITYRNVQKWDEYAHSRVKAKSSIYDYHKILKIYVREAFMEGLIKSNPYQNYKLTRGITTNRKFLTKEELKAIETKKIENQKLEHVRDVFVFCCYTGLAYSDLAKFDFKSAIMTNGMYRIRDYRIKTEVPYNITLMDKPMSILRKYDFHLPVISNQKYNDYLKVLAAACGVKKKLTSHVARHTFATTVTMANHVPIEVISKMLGHTNIQTTQLYAKVCQQEVDQEFDRLNKIL